MEIDKVAFLCIQNKKLLAVISKGKDTFYMPGGKREKNETDEQTLVREIKEELSVDIIPETIKYYNTFKAQAHGRPGTIKMACYTAEFSGRIAPANEIERTGWITSEETSVGPVAKLLLADLKMKGLIE